LDAVLWRGQQKSADHGLWGRLVRLLS